MIGSEAAFERAILDGFFPLLKSGDRSACEPGVGRVPFGPTDWRMPWRGGDTAWPHFPPYFLQVGFETAFPPPSWRDKADYDAS